MAIKQEKLEQILAKAFPNAQINVIDLAGDDDHYRLEIGDASFVGKNRVQQHRMVNEALKEELKADLHAMQLKTFAV